MSVIQGDIKNEWTRKKENVTTIIQEERCETIEFKGQKILVYHFTVRAVDKSGRFAEAVGSASSDEGRTWAETVHGIRTQAQTRATNRAVSNLVGGGEINGEELDSKHVESEFRVKEPPYNRAGQSSDEVTGEQDIQEVLIGAGLDPTGVNVKVFDFGKFEIRPAVDMDNLTWRKYSDALKPLGANYHGKNDAIPEIRGAWSIG